MPFYEYECSNCRFYVEVLQKISEPPLKKCPSCGKSALKKLVSAPVFRLKGSGWYETDFKSDQDGRRNLAGADKDAPAAPAESKDAGKLASAEGATSSTAAPAAESTTAPASATPAAPAASAPKPRMKRAAKRAPVRPRHAKAKRRGGR